MDNLIFAGYEFLAAFVPFLLVFLAVSAFIGLLLFRIWKKLTKSKHCFPSISWEELLLYMLVLFLGRALLFNEMGFAGLLYKF